MGGASSPKQEQHLSSSGTTAATAAGTSTGSRRAPAGSDAFAARVAERVLFAITRLSWWWFILERKKVRYVCRATALGTQECDPAEHGRERSALMACTSITHTSEAVEASFRTEHSTHKSLRQARR